MFALPFFFSHARLLPIFKSKNTKTTIVGGGAIEVTWSGSEDPSARDMVSFELIFFFSVPRWPTSRPPTLLPLSRSTNISFFDLFLLSSPSLSTKTDRTFLLLRSPAGPLRAHQIRRRSQGPKPPLPREWQGRVPGQQPAVERHGRDDQQGLFVSSFFCLFYIFALVVFFSLNCPFREHCRRAISTRGSKR